MKDTAKTTLYYRNPPSDKVYTAAIEEAPGCVSSKDGQLYRVTFAFGRRGDTLKPGTKTPTPVTRKDAEKIFNKLVSEKKAKGYTEGEDGTPYVGGDEEARATGIACQLLVAVDSAEANRLTLDDSYGAQEKYDGKRMLLHAERGTVVAINRKGLTCGFPDSIMRTMIAAHAQYGELLLDGEAVGDTLFAFDILRFGKMNAAIMPFQDRHQLLTSFFTRPPSGEFMSAVRVAPLALGSEAKLALYQRLHAAKKEGIVYKHLEAPYQPGKPSSGGTQFKFKFVQTCTCLVIEDNRSRGKRSVELGMVGNPQTDGLVRVGQCTIPPNKEFPKVMTLCDVRYLYAYPGGCLIQPFYLGERDDLEIADQYTSLKFKSQGGVDEEAE